jgi:hypothetical protein
LGVAEEVQPTKAGKDSSAENAGAKQPEPVKAPERRPGHRRRRKPPAEGANGAEGAAPESTEATPDAPGGEAAETPHGGERAETILHALDLVEDGQRETEGERAGKPTVAAIAEITGLADVTAEEIDAASCSPRRRLMREGFGGF